MPKTIGEAYFERLVQESMAESGTGRERAEEVQRSNLGYFAGYYDHATRERVERLFRCAHPVFGSISEQGAPSAYEAFGAGVAAAKG